MTLTTPGCPVSESLPAEAAQALEAALGVPARVVVVWDPPWTPDRIDPAAAAALGLRR
jgi:metal-sulfur cluster biosynthetic enzyme